MSERIGAARGDRPGERETVRRRRGFSAWNLLLLVPIIGTLLPWTYNRPTPMLWSIPFFYWYQMAWIILSVIVTVIVYRATKGTR